MEFMQVAAVPSVIRSIWQMSELKDTESSVTHNSEEFVCKSLGLFRFEHINAASSTVYALLLPFGSDQTWVRY